MKNIIVVGAELVQTVTDEALGEIVMVKPDGRYTDPDKVAASIVQNRAKAVASARDMKLVVDVARLYATNLTTRAVFDSADNDTVPPAVSFTGWLLTHQGLVYPDYPGERALPAALYGLNIKETIRAVGISCARAGVPVPLSLWYDNRDCYNPYQMLVEDDKIFDLRAVCMLSGCTPHDIGVDPRADVALTIELMTRYGLAPLAVEPRVKQNRPVAVKKKKGPSVPA